ncbi:MAG TPA: hypothetical protein VF885_03750 [Arthrobacter sp.]
MPESTYNRCVNPTCDRPMRPRGYTVEMAPGTVAMGHKGMCKSCVQPRRESKPRAARRQPVRPEAGARTAHIVKGLEAFYARRYARGVAPEATASIVYAQPAATVTELRPAVTKSRPAELQAA